MNSKEQEMWDLLDDVVNSLAVLRFHQRNERDHVGVMLTGELIDRVKVQLKKLEEV